MYNIILELAFKCSSLEKKVEELSKGTSMKKSKIHILDYLNSNITPTSNFIEWSEHFNTINEDIEFLINDKTNSVHDVMMRIIERTTDMNMTYDSKTIDEYPYPIICISQKQKTFYIYLEEWTICPSDQFILFVKIIHSKLFNQLCIWNQKNKQRLNDNEKLDDQYNNVIGRIAGYKFAEESTDMNKLRTSLYQYMKLDLKEVNFS